MAYKKSHTGLWTGALLALFVSASFQAGAAPAMPHDKCRVTGTITSIEKIEIERGGSQSWRDSWGVSDSYHETEIKLDVSDIVIIEDEKFDDTSCTLEKAEKGYYLMDNSGMAQLFTDFNEGDCITAETNISGDEFRIGNWIYDIENLPATACKEHHPDTD